MQQFLAVFHPESKLFLWSLKLSADVKLPHHKVQPLAAHETLSAALQK